MTDASLFRDKGVEFYTKAVAAENAKDFETALRLYQACIEHFILACKYERVETIRNTLADKTTEILNHAEQLKLVMIRNSKTNEKVPVEQQDANDKQEKNPLVAGLESNIVQEKPNVKWADIAVSAVHEPVDCLLVC
jgi:hypothetical protein